MCCTEIERTRAWFAQTLECRCSARVLCVGVLRRVRLLVSQLSVRLYLGSCFAVKCTQCRSTSDNGRPSQTTPRSGWRDLMPALWFENSKLINLTPNLTSSSRSLAPLVDASRRVRHGRHAAGACLHTGSLRSCALGMALEGAALLGPQPEGAGAAAAPTPGALALGQRPGAHQAGLPPQDAGPDHAARRRLQHAPHLVQGEPGLHASRVPTARCRSLERTRVRCHTGGHPLRPAPSERGPLA